ncbi:MAG: tRNA (adenosine(37)-N6)-threonylcarbamoyltransferase complex transferase subunit TsaD [Elusimicrobia bacterium]|nr:tRNA (adenosine(37)-N6)-threonylcarbamoyltransferase complex transferase subunit TsaD [Elusimicrobiota bacterium]
MLLGIETTCDETGAGIVELCPDKKFGQRLKIRANVLASQIPLHAPYFGVVPELASRAHLENIHRVVAAAFKQSGLAPLHAIAYAQGPGLKGALLVGESVARALALALDIPAIGVHHLEAHLCSVLFEYPEVRPPFLGLIVSGGHTDLIYVERWGKYRVLGRTLDDACGEAFDKFSKMLRLGYPGGPIVDRLARSGDAGKIRFPRPLLEGSWNFSFSGLKTSALYRLRDYGQPKTARARADLAAAFQEAVCETLVFKSKKALRNFNLKTMVVSGGAAANSRLRELLLKSAVNEGFRVYFPSPAICTDNGAMIAAAGALRLAVGALLKGGAVEHAVPCARQSRKAVLCEDTGHGAVDPSLPFPSW